ncbi:MAG TPA: hypothetical protein PLD59_14445, partial [Tepidisphaeraceae bacterium]|nr:hypothetical protein [Tepidisphaeraceae bacterium]
MPSPTAGLMRAAVLVRDSATDRRRRRRFSAAKTTLRYRSGRVATGKGTRFSRERRANGPPVTTYHRVPPRTTIAKWELFSREAAADNSPGRQPGDDRPRHNSPAGAKEATRQKRAEAKDAARPA